MHPLENQAKNEQDWSTAVLECRKITQGIKRDMRSQIPAGQLWEPIEFTGEMGRCNSRTSLVYS